jgi:GR25 family glycosyltransferase involved in LPS biosynthesis
VNLTFAADLPTRWLSWWKYVTRKVSRRHHSTAFSSADADAIGRIEVINLDRAMDRWARLHAELGKHTDAAGQRLTSITQRFRATDARNLDPRSISARILIQEYTLAQQFSVDPQYANFVNEDAFDTVVTMTKQEIAIALSHIEVWKTIAASQTPFTLILEDDVYFTRGSARGISRTWNHINTQELDLLYLSFRETGTRHRKAKKRPARRPDTGLWHASGYVLSAAGARKLLAALPVVGPVDLWLNVQFEALHVFVADHPHIEQRPGVPSSNSYSVMPALSKVGAIRREAPQLVRRSHARDPIIVVGSDRPGLASVAVALSVLGYRTAAHIDVLPDAEIHALRSGRSRRVFDAYVDIGFSWQDLEEMTSRGARLITVDNSREPTHRPSLLPDLTLSVDREPWRQLTGFLNAPYPDEPWPTRLEHPRTRTLESGSKRHRDRHSRWDHGPWILRREPVAPVDAHLAIDAPGRQWTTAEESWNTLGQWYARADTFPSNRALFRPENVTQQTGGRLALQLTESQNTARPLAGAAIATQAKYRFGRFGAELRAAAGSGVVTGLFLHRNAPRQEIDIEILGHRPTEMLVNVFFNPGNPGTRLETGYYGTPVRIPLGFDSTQGFHRYEIDWAADYIQWRVDGRLVHERSQWTPTPIPDQPMEINLNVWSSESVRFAGPFDEAVLPLRVEVASLNLPNTPAESEVEGPERAASAVPRVDSF